MTRLCRLQTGISLHFILHSRQVVLSVLDKNSGRKSMKVLIIGAGAVGQVYAHHLVKGGAEVSFYIKEKYSAELQQGVHLYQHSVIGKLTGGRTKHTLFQDFKTISSTQELEAESYDYIINTVSSTALRSGWWEAFKNASGKALIIGLQPALDDTQFILKTLPEPRYIKGLIQFISYQSPLPGGKEPAGYHYLLPPVAGLFENAKGNASPLMSALIKGGFKAKKQNDLNFFSSSLSSISIPLTAALEKADWSIKKLLTDNNLKEGLASSLEANIAVSQALNKPASSPRLLKPWISGLLLKIMPAIFPFDIEVYLKFHFSKVGDQTRLMLEQYIAHAKVHQLDHSATSALLDSLYEIDSRDQNKT